MPANIPKLLLKKKSQLLELWMQNQLSSDALRDDLITNDDLRQQSDELVDILVKNLGAISAEGLDQIYDILNSISITRARQGFSPRETGLFVFGLKDAILSILDEELKNDITLLHEESIKWLPCLTNCLLPATKHLSVEGKK